ncbi:YciI family protein [Neisseria chenwenguii]|uniref:GTP cyclohydrolase n=1 Tax=Neisseria chenwenguii TaxID=1853278 RepID=A0A220S482_9NEIS|nr:YciI family protein [Neisseria chenwenguii]ASK28247.1 GTP cyclohydrolase [Neisseria chenwenguii]ROV57372.1 GTP cyclohydrolase [Neisseria chenwenguii]
MFIVSLNYIRPMAEIEQHLTAHRDFLDRYYAAGVFLMSGRKEPRTGGVILMNAENAEAVQRIIAEDPFYQAGVAEYETIEFLPSKTSADLAQYKQI